MMENWRHLEALVHEAVDDGVHERVGHAEPVAQKEQHRHERGHVGQVYVVVAGEGYVDLE